MRRYIRIILLVLPLVMLIWACAWVQWGRWPSAATQAPVGTMDAIVILGGGDEARWRHGAELALSMPSVPVIVTGDRGIVVDYLRAHGVPWERILHEDAALSTVENAKFTESLLNRIGAKRVVLVTNWFHTRRALAIFKSQQEGREFYVSYSERPDPPREWDLATERRERMAALHNLIFHGVWSWGQP